MLGKACGVVVSAEEPNVGAEQAWLGLLGVFLHPTNANYRECELS